MPLIGTAGHVDHGKSTIVALLTGRDPDRWAEEKRRGLTIDLGFAWTDIDGSEVSFVDVPGHERYSKNMLAGVGALDAALLVVAANEGWMPQTEEHAAVLDLLGIERVLVVISKSDLVDDETIELVQLEVEDRLEGTGIVGSPSVVTNARDPESIGNLRLAISELIAHLPHHEGRARLWIDRSFPVAGAGTVVTGSLVGSELTTGDKVEIYPGGQTSKVRSIQSHESETSVAYPGSRVALGLVGVDTSVAARGSMIGSPGAWLVSNRFTAWIRKARYVDELTEKGSYQIHIGSTGRIARLRVEQDVAMITSDSPIPLAMGDRFIIRDTGRRLVVAGGRILDPRPGATAGALDQAPDLKLARSPDERATALLKTRGWAEATELSNSTDGGTPADTQQTGDYLVSARFLDEARERAERAVRAWHTSYPLRVGMPSATLEDRLGLPVSIVASVVESSPDMSREGPDVAHRSHQTELPDESARKWEQVRERLAADLAVPSVADLDLDEEIIHLLGRTGELTRVSEDLIFLPSQIGQIEEAVMELVSPFQVGDLKDSLGLSRKYIVPILEWLDSTERTVRRPEGRVHGPSLSGRDG